MRVRRIPGTFSPISFRLGRRDAGRRRLSRCWGRCPLARDCPGMASDCPCLDRRCWPLSPAGGIRLRAIGAHMTANSSRIGKFLTVPEMDGLDGRFNPPPSLPCRAWAPQTCPCAAPWSGDMPASEFFAKGFRKPLGRCLKASFAAGFAAHFVLGDLPPASLPCRAAGTHIRLFCAPPVRLHGFRLP